MTETQGAPAVPRGWGCFQRFGEVSGRSDGAFLGIEGNLDFEDLPTFQSRGLAVAPSQGNADHAAHGRDRAAICVAVKSDANRRANLAKHWLRVEGDRDV